MAARLDEVLLRSVRVRARGGGARERVAAELRRTLQRARLPELPDDEVVVVRRLALRGRLGELGAALRESLVTALASGSFERVRFASPEEMVAAVATAIARGEAARWPWRALLPTGEREPGAALRALFLDHAPRLAAVMVRLERAGVADAVVVLLSSAAAREVAGAVAAAAGCRVPTVATAVGATATAAPKEAPPLLAAQEARLDRSLDRPRATPPAVPRAGVASNWRALAPDDGRVVLRVLLDWIANRPRALAAAVHDDAQARRFAEECRARVAAPPLPRVANEGVDGRTVPFGRARRAASDAVVPQEAPSPPSAATSAAPPRPRAAAPPFLRAAAASDDPLLERIDSAWCGTFRLLPFLLGRAAQEQLAAAPWWQAGGGGFALLRALALALGLPSDDPLADWLARAAAQVDAPPDAAPRDAAPHDVPQHDVPQHDVAPLVETLVALGGLRFGAALFSPSLLRARGRLLVRPGRLDVCLPATAVRLDVRLAGLDVDPGFVPWLGVALRFHYDFGAGEPR
ncbi:MAG: hypothetical protein JNL90_20980 [Planctomycetes bacterium]|nr:hypothetical protein [Planctomycetota bacterium]